MKTKCLFLTVVCLILGLNIKAQDDYRRITDLSEIQNGSTIIFAARHDSLSVTSYYAMTNAAAGKPQGVMFSSDTSGEGEVLPSEIINNESDYCWTVGMSGTDYTFINADGDMIGYGSSGTDFVKNGTNSTWTIALSTSGEGTSVPNYSAFVITNVGASNRSFAFRKYNSGEPYEKFAPYSNSASNMGGVNYFFYIDIFVKSSEVTPVVSLPTFNPAGGDYTTAQNVNISCDTDGATIYYTTNGDNPTEESEVYSSPIEVSATTTIKAFAKKDGMTNSGIASATYNIIEAVTVSFYDNGSLLETISVPKGDEIGELPETTAPDGFSFSGWTENEISGNTNISPVMMTTSSVIEDDMSVHAVFSISNNNCVEAEITSFSPTDAVIIAISKDEKYYAMSQIKGGSGQPTAYELMVSDDKIIGAVPDDIKWNISYDNGDMIIYPDADEENWLYCTSGSNNNSVRIGTNTDNNVFEIKTVQIEDEVFPDYLYNKTTERFVGAYYDGDVAIDWRAYKLTASGSFPTNIKNQTYHFYKAEGTSYYCTDIDIPQSQTIATNTTWENVSITNKITIEDGAILAINGLIGCSDVDNLVIKEGGQLIHNNAGVKATLEKEIEGYGSTNESWYTISSPLMGNVALSDVESLIPTTNNYDLYRYDEPTSVWQNVKQTSNNFANLENGRGYLYANEYDATLSFAGELNGDDVTYHLSKTENIVLSGFHLIGNPFTHNIYKGVGAAIDDNNLAAGYYTLSDAGAWGAKISDDIPIAPGQGILVKTSKEGDVKIKKTNTQPSQKSNADILAITVNNNEYEDKAFAVFEDGVALEKVNHQNQDVPMIYLPVDDANYAVAMLDDNIKDIPLSFKANTMGEYTITINSDNRGFEHIYLVDSQTGNVTNMLVDEYTFIATTNDNPNRFVIKLYDVDSVNEISNDENYIYIDNGDLVVGNIKGAALIDIYDILGRDIMKLETTEKEVRMNVSEFNMGIYIVRITDDNGVKTRKVIVE